ncbi:TPA: phage antirepressor N-terminal domain-containing protein [Yersinia enterocolitica]
MTSIAIIEAVNTTAVQFHGQHIITAMVAGVAYVAMRPIVENLGMSWSTQRRKLNGLETKFGCVHMSTPSNGGVQEMLCLPLRKLNGWLFSINPGKVRADIRDKLIRYQEECFTALHDYFTRGEAKRQGTSTDERTPLRSIVNRIMGKYGMTYQAVYKIIHKEFGVNHIDELSGRQTAEAIDYLAGKVIEGEFLGKEPIQIQRRADYNYPIESADPHDRIFGNDWMSPRTILDERNRAPELELIEQLEKDGYDLTGVKVRIHAMYGIAKQVMHLQETFGWCAKEMKSVTEALKNNSTERGMNVSFTGNNKGSAIGGYTKRSLR